MDSALYSARTIGIIHCMPAGEPMRQIGAGPRLVNLQSIRNDSQAGNIWNPRKSKRMIKIQ